jgi:hypothetical protein
MDRTAGLSVALSIGLASIAVAEVGDPQIATDHPWYPGELAFSDFPRLSAHQAAVYEQVTGRKAESDQDKVLASWLWRNAHYWHGEAGNRDYWGDGFNTSKDTRIREYWSGLFAYGFGLCGTTHSQWTAEFNALLGHGRARGVGVAGHNAFEVFLQDPVYGEAGNWALLDHDLSTVIFSKDGHRLLGLAEIQGEVEQWIRQDFEPQKQQGWLVCGLHPKDGGSYSDYRVAEYFPGYAGPPPMVHLRRGETMRRYFEPGLEDGKTFVFWGRNYDTDGIAGPERSRTWVNQPEKMHGATSSTPHQNGQVRFANVEYRYRPDFASEYYREGMIEEGADFVTLEFQTPYVIGATPPNDEPWGIYDDGCTNGLVVSGSTSTRVSLSTDAGASWSDPQPLENPLDLTDLAKGRSQYWLKLHSGAADLAAAGIEIRTVCQANVAVLPRLKDGTTTIRYQASNRRVVSAGPELNLAQRHVSEGAFGENRLTMTLPARGKVVGLCAAAHIASSSPPSPDIRYQIEYRVGGGGGWQPFVSDWSIPRRGDEPSDFWSQSFCYGSKAIDADPGTSVEIRFRNDGGKRYLRTEAHLVEATSAADPVHVTYHWENSDGSQEASHIFEGAGSWKLPTGANVQTRWVEFESVNR